MTTYHNKNEYVSDSRIDRNYYFMMGYLGGGIWHSFWPLKLMEILFVVESNDGLLSMKFEDGNVWYKIG